MRRALTGAVAWRIALTVAAGLLHPTPARAHGGSPVALDLLGDGPAAARALETTFGLIQREPTGAWTLSCEEAVSPGWKDYVRLPGGRIGMAHGGGYSWSDDACTFTEAVGLTGAGREAHVLVDPEGTRVVLLTDSRGSPRPFVGR